MAIKIGRNQWLGVGIETTPGTAVDPAKYLPFTTCTLRQVIDVLDDEAAKGVRERNWGSVAGPNRGEGDIEILVDAENAPYLLIPALGSVSSTTASGETAVYEHTITRKNTNPPTTLTINYNDTVSTRKYTYAVVNTLELTVSDGLATMTAGILSKAPVSGTGTKSITEETVLAFKDYTVKFGSSLSDAATADPTKLSAFRLRINNNAEPQYLSGSNSPDSISMGQLEIEGDYTLFFENTTEQSAYENQTKRAMIVTFTGASIGNSETEEIKINIPRFHIRERAMDTAPAGFITENPTFVVDYDSTEAKSIEIVVTNETSSY